jgi:hypothetical protein
MQRVDTEQEMRFLLLEKDIDNRDSLDLITQLKISAFLESKFADNVVKEIWRSPYSTNDSLFSASTNHQLTFGYWNCIQDQETMNRFYHEKDITSFEAHPLQFTVWRYSGKSRIIVEFVSTILLSIVIHIFVNFVLKASPDFNHKMKVFVDFERYYLEQNTTSPGYIDIYREYINVQDNIKVTVQDFFDKAMIVSYLSFLPMFYGIQHMFNIIYASINKRQINPYSFLGLIDFLIFTIFLTNIFITYA